MQFKLEGIYKRTNHSIGYLWRDDDFSTTQTPLLFDMDEGMKRLEHWKGYKYLEHIEFRLVSEEVDALECTLEDEEFSHQETLQHLKVAKEKIGQLEAELRAAKLKLRELGHG